MCKHFAHKIPVEYDDSSGLAHLPDGTLSMKASEDGVLVFSVTAADVQKLLKTRYVVDAHIVRFAFREAILGLDWRSEAA